jgi:hypothetical protein
MSEDARLGVLKGYKDGWAHDTSMVGSIWYSIIANDSIIPTDLLTIYMTYGYGPNEIPDAVAATGEYPDDMFAKTPVGTTVTFYAKPLDSKPLYSLPKSAGLTGLSVKLSWYWQHSVKLHWL